MSQPVEGLVARTSAHDPKTAADRLADALVRRGVSVAARINHAAAAARAGLELRPTEVLIFGNPKVGSPLMQQAQTLGIDLPLKALVWGDEAGVTWIGYNDPHWIARRHGIEGAGALDGMQQMLEEAVAEAAD
jgi:uncharacterized protein (DUF302 family)